MQARTHRAFRCTLARHTHVQTHCQANILQAVHPGAFTRLPGFTLLHTYIYLSSFPFVSSWCLFRPYPGHQPGLSCYHPGWAIWPGVSVCGGAGRIWRKGGVRREKWAALGTGRHLLLTPIRHSGWPGAFPLEPILQLEPSPSLPLQAPLSLFPLPPLS